MTTPSESGIVSIFDTIPAYVFTVDEDVRILDCNKAAAGLLRDNRENALRHHGIETEYCIQSHYVPKGSGQHPACEKCDIRHSISRAFNGNTVIRKHALLEISQDGKITAIPALITASSQILEDKKRVTLMIEDLSEHKRIKKAEEGLTIPRQLARLMGGNINAESTEGQGSNFLFSAVLAKQAGNQRKSTSAAFRLGSSVKFGNGARLLLADDDSNNRTVIQLILRKFGFQVDVKSNGQEVLQALATGDYDMVLMDCMMPVMNGYQATQEIRNPSSSVRNHSIPVIALTANAFKEDRNICLEAGMDDYLSKPLEVPKMLAMLGKWLKGCN